MPCSSGRAVGSGCSAPISAASRNLNRQFLAAEKSKNLIINRKFFM